MTSLTYNIVEEDFEASLMCLNPLGRKLRIGAVLAFFLAGLAYGFLLLDDQDKIASIVPSVAIFCVLVGFFWSQGRRQQRLVRNANVTAKYWIVGEQTLTFTDSGIDRQASNEHSHKGWSSVSEVIENPSHLFICFPFQYSWIVPLRDAPDVVRQDLIKVMTNSARTFRKVAH